MKIDVLTLFPEMFTAVTESSILGRAGEKGIININLINIRDYSRDKHNKADDTPFGGGPGMVMLADPIFGALEASSAGEKRILYMSPRGRVLDHDKIRELSEEEELVILCGHTKDRSESYRLLGVGRCLHRRLYTYGRRAFLPWC